MALNIVLLEPEIPQNTGNIARTCAATGANLHLIGPMGFSIDEKHVKRAGLDYWDKVNIKYYNNIEEFYEQNPGEYYFATTKAPHTYASLEYKRDCYIFFGKETKGLPEDLLKKNLDRCVRLPMREDIRSLNLSNSVCVFVYEYYRQHGFVDLQGESTYLTGGNADV